LPDEALALEAESTADGDDVPVLASTDVDAIDAPVTAGEGPVEPARAVEPITVTASPDDPDAAGAEAEEAKPARRRRRASSPVKAPEPASV
jgi:hypothetical protein